MCFGELLRLQLFWVNCMLALDIVFCIVVCKNCLIKLMEFFSTQHPMNLIFCDYEC